MSKLAKALTAAAGNAGGESLYVEDVFSTYLYTGNGSTQTITNDIDLDGEGGLTWIKWRSGQGISSSSHLLFDTERGVQKALLSDQTLAELTDSAWLTAFNTDGFAVGDSGSVNNVNNNYASWTFRKAEKFFDVVTWTGDGSNTRRIPHNINGSLGFIVVKKTSASQDWVCAHSYDSFNNNFKLNTTGTTFGAGYIDTPNETSFGVNAYGNPTDLNTSGQTYVAYLFASDAGGFGDDGSESIIKCGSFTADGSGNATVNLGFEPQWLLMKSPDDSGDAWRIIDNMRGWSDNSSVQLNPNESTQETAIGSSSNPFYLTSTGFVSEGAINHTNSYIYIAIRRPMKTPESGTEVFAIDTADGSTLPQYKAGFVIDAALRVNNVTASHNNFLYSRLTQGKYLVTESTNAEGSSTAFPFDYMNGYCSLTSVDSNNYSWMFKRATGFFDVVAYTGTESNRTINHNLGVAPEMMIIKARESLSPYVAGWVVYHSAISPADSIYLSQNGSSSGASFKFASTAPTNSVFTLGSAVDVNMSGKDFISYHFATLDGVSKVGSYTGTGSNVDVDCGFSAGARFILIKRTDSTGDWYVWDSVRGIVAGNDPYLLLNSTAAEVTSTDYIDPLSSGFTVTSSAPAALNASGGTYIFLAIA